MPTETNSFKIAGLETLTTRYRLFKVAGLRPDGMDYYGNLQKIVRSLSFQMKAPITTYHRDGEAHVLVPNDAGEPPAQLLLVGTVATLRSTNEDIDLSFDA